MPYAKNAKPSVPANESLEDAVDRADTEQPGEALSIKDWLNEDQPTNRFTRRMMKVYPAWLETLTPRVDLHPLPGRRLSVWVGGRRIQHCEFYKLDPGFYVRLSDARSEDLELLRARLSDPENLRVVMSTGAGTAGRPAYRFTVKNDADYELLQHITAGQIQGTPMSIVTAPWPEASLPAAEANGQQAPPSSSSPPAGRSQMTMAEAAYTILQKAGGGPLHLNTILQQALEHEMIQPTGQTPLLSLSTVLIRDKARFINLGRNRWQLVRPLSLSTPEIHLLHTWPTLTQYRDFVRQFSAQAYTPADLYQEAQTAPGTLTDGLRPDDIVADLLQLRLLAPLGDGTYQPRDYVIGDPATLMRLMALALLLPDPDKPDHYFLPVRDVFPTLQSASAQPIEVFAPRLGAEGPALLGWYQEAGLVSVDETAATWGAAPGALDLQTPAGDRAVEMYNRFVTALVGNSNTVPGPDLAPLTRRDPLPIVTDLAARLVQLGGNDIPVFGKLRSVVLSAHSPSGGSYRART